MSYRNILFTKNDASLFNANDGKMLLGYLVSPPRRWKIS
jgi:hypothetical protein